MVIRGEGYKNSQPQRIENIFWEVASGMKKREFTQEELVEMYRLYTEQQYSLKRLEKEFHCGYAKLCTVFEEQGWHRRNVQETNCKSFSEEELIEMVHKYTVDKIGSYTLAKQFKCSEKAIQTALKNRGIKLRTYVEAKQEGRKYQIDDDFFKHQNHNMAYVLGLIAADGCVATKENSLSIQLRDYDGEILEKINNLMQSTYTVKYYTDGKNIDYLFKKLPAPAVGILYFLYSWLF